MNDSESNSPLIQRLAERLTTPGVVDRAPSIERAAKLRAPTEKHPVAERLSLRALPASDSPFSSGNSLVWQTPVAQGSAVAEPAMSGSVIRSATTASMPVVTVQRSASSSASPTSGLQLPVTRRDLPISRIVSPTPSSVSDTRSAIVARVQSDPVAASASPIALVKTAAAAPTIMRKASGPPMSSMHSSARATMPMPAATNRSESPVLVDRATPSIRSTTLARVSAAMSPTPIVAQSPSAPPTTASTPMVLARKADNGTAAIAGSSQASKFAHDSAPLSAAAPLLMRKMATPPSGLPPIDPHPLTQTSAPDPAAGSTAQVSEAKAPETANPHSDIDSIAEQVGQRLAERLTIERERRGLRRWR